MNNNRRKFLKLAGLTGIGLTSGGLFNGFASRNNNDHSNNNFLNTAAVDDNNFDEQSLSIIGLYGEWANTLNKNKLPAFSFRRNEWKNLEAWKKVAKKRLTDKLAIPNTGGAPKVVVKNQRSYDGLHVEEISWQLPYGRATEAILLKPENAKGKLPAILAFHDHSGEKYFGYQSSSSFYLFYVY